MNIKAKKKFLLGVTAVLAVLFFGQFQAVAYSPTCTHPTISNQIFVAYAKAAKMTISGWQLEQIAAGAKDEDSEPRWINHFYDKQHDRGWVDDTGTGILEGLVKLNNIKALPTPTWAVSSEAQKASPLFNGDYSWPAAIEFAAQGLLVKAIYALGHILHLLEDLTVPAHTRNDTHIWTTLIAEDGTTITIKGDPNEVWLEDDCQNGRLTFAATADLSVSVNNLVDILEKTAEETGSRFFSADTINDKNFSAPAITHETVEIGQDGKKRRYAMGAYSNGKEYHLARISATQKFIFWEEYKYTLDYVCVRDAWNHASDWLMQYGPAVVDFYYRSAEAVKRGCKVDQGAIDCSGAPGLDGGVGVDSGVDGGVDSGVLPNDAGQVSDVSRDASNDVVDSGTQDVRVTDAHVPDISAQDAGNQPDRGLICQDGEEQICLAGLGVCAQGRQICVKNQWDVCQQEIFPNSELCDGLDNDCDGQTDEDFLGLNQRCLVGTGACVMAGSFICASDKKSVICSAVAGRPSVEICNDKLDNDCDGQTDEVDECPIQPPVIDAPISGVIPDVFSYSGGKFQIHVSPTDPTGKLITQNVTTKNFSFSRIVVASYQAPTVMLTTGQAQVDSVEIKTLTAPGKGATLLLMFDSSGSMTTSDPSRKRVEAGKAFVDAMSANDRAAVLDFGAGSSSGFSASRLLQDLTSDKGKLKTAIDLVESNGMTPLYDSLMEGLGLIEKWSYSNPSALVLTDGQDTASTRYGYTQVIAKAQQLQTPLYIVPLGDQIDFSILQEMADKSGGALGEAYSAQKLIERFKAAGTSMRLGKIVVHGSGIFSPPLTKPDRYLVNGVLRTSIGGASADTPFEFSVDIRQ